jgi:microcystin degradation protein MlrC
MTRILINECKQEISSFNPVPCRYDDFSYATGPDLLTIHQNVGTEVAGALEVFAKAPDIEIVPGYSARSITSGGTLARDAFERMSREFLAAVRDARDVDAIYFCLHGALAAETESDVEGHLLEETRRIVGERTPIVVSLDLHGILTDRILRHSDAVVVYHTYPHVDFYQTGARAARLLLRILREGVRPVSVRVPIPALVRGNELITATGMFGQCVRRAIAIENGPGGLSAGMFIGNPFTDVPDLCTNAFIVLDGDAERAAREAIDIARDFWAMRQHLQQPLTPLAESIRLASLGKGRIVLVDAADATSSGASGDSNAILRAMLEAGYRRTALIPIVDAPAVEAAFQAGVGATIATTIGGSLDPVRFPPLPIQARVRMLSDGRFPSESHGDIWDGGRTAVLELGSITLVVTSRPVNLYDRSLFLAHGQNPANFQTVVVKSPHCQPQFFEEGAESLIHVDAPGASSANLRSLGHKNCARPIFPLDENVEFTPQPRLFTRQQGQPQ